MKARLGAVLVIAVLLAPACEGDRHEKAAQTTIHFATHGWTKTEIYDDLMVAFEEENPDLNIEFVSAEETLGIDPMGPGSRRN